MPTWECQAVVVVVVVVVVVLPQNPVNKYVHIFGISDSAGAYFRGPYFFSGEGV